MHTVVETPAYIAQAKSEGMTVAEMTAAVNIIAAMAKAIIEAHRPKGVFGLWVR